MTIREWVCYWAATNTSKSDLRSNFIWMQVYMAGEGIREADPDDDYAADTLRDRLFNGELLAAQVDATVIALGGNLMAQAIEQFKDWDIPMDKYDYSVEFDSYNAEITFTHKVNGVTLTLDDVFFSLEGHILECVHKFQGGCND